MRKPIESEEEFRAYEREVVGPRYDAYIADPANVISAEELEVACRQWDREDGLEDEIGDLKRSA